MKISGSKEMREQPGEEKKVSIEVPSVDVGELSQDEGCKVEGGRTRKARGKGEEDGADVTKRRRTWELWSVGDKHIFFEALNEFGKDFDKIQAHFQSKLKNKKNFPADYIKNKNQIRHFYYRSWHKISAYISFDADLKKSTKELFGLINYGELWKKIGGTIDDKLGAKLDELVQKGLATLKHKGKTFRIKTPVCRALKRIHNKGDITGKQKGGKVLPSRVVIDLRPRETRDWYRVQKLAQNPHIKVSLLLQRKVSSLINCLLKKWKSREEKLMDSLQGAPSPCTGCVELVLYPVRGAKIKLPVINAAPVITSSQISLQSMKPTSLNTNFKPSIKVVKENNGNAGSGGAEPFTQTPHCDRIFIQSDNGSQEENEVVEEDLLELWDAEGSRSPVPAPDTNQDKESDLEIEEDEEKDEQDEEKAPVVEPDSKDDKTEILKTNFSNLKSFDPTTGWSLKTVEGLTVGELYFMLCEEGGTSFQLEYHWREVKDDPNPGVECQSLLTRLIKLSSSQPSKPGRGRQNSLSTNSPTVRNLMSPVSPTTSRQSPAGRNVGAGRGVAKQLPLISELPEKPGSPLAVPLEPETEFRKPLAPAPTLKPAAMSSTFQKQIGQYFPKFSNRRGRVNRNRAKNQLVGRQILQPIQPLRKPPSIQHLVLPLTTTNPLAVATNNFILETPLTIIQATNIPSTSLLNVPMSPIVPSSPPQICIPSPAISPPRRSPSPTPSFSCLMDMSFSESAPSTPSKDQFMSMMDEGSLLHTPPRPSSPAPTSPSRCLTESGDLSLTSWALSFDSPVKNSPFSSSSFPSSSSSSASAPNLHNDDSQASTISTNSEVDRQRRQEHHRIRCVR
jgi:hypothetical protein